MQQDQAPSQEDANLEQLHVSVEVTEKADEPLYRETVILAGVLGLFLGCLGVHNFMTHNPKRGKIQLALTVSGLCIISIVAIIANIESTGCGPAGAVTAAPCEIKISFETINAIRIISFFGLVMPSVIWGTLESFWMLVAAGKYPLKNDPNKPDEPRKPMLY